MKKIQKAMQALKTAFETKPYSVLFIVCVLVSFGIYLLAGLLSLGRTLTSVFYVDMTDAFMDFFNSIRDASLGDGAYTVRKVIYPPMANLFFWLLSFISPSEYNVTEFEDRYTWMQYDTLIWMIVVFLAVCVLLLGLLICKSLKVEKKGKWLLVLTLIFGIPCLNMLERGNLLLVSLIALMVYALTYHSKHAFVRELGLIAIAFSFSLKFYPIIFAWILLGDKRIKEFIRCALYSVIFLVAPSFAFGGPIRLVTIFQNIFSFSSGSGSNLDVISRYSHIPSFLVSGFFYLWFLLCALNFALAPFVHKESWKVWIGGCVAFIAFPSLTTIYAWTLFVIPLIMMFNEGMKGRKNWGYFIPILIPFLFFPIPIPTAITVNIVLVYPALIAVSAYTMWDTFKVIKQKRKEKRSAAELAE